jgi:hypothetical protein
MSFPFDLHSAAVSDSHLPCCAHAIPEHAVLLKATAQHSRRETVWGLLSRVRFLPATTQSSTKLLWDAYQSQMQVASVKLNTVCMGEEKGGRSTIQKKTICYTVGLAIRIFCAIMRTFTKDAALSEQGRGAAWHVWINARHGRGTACYVWIGLYSPDVAPCVFQAFGPLSHLKPVCYVMHQQV